MIGTMNALFDLSVLNLLMFIFGVSSGPYFAIFKSTSFLLAATNSYIWNRFWTFNRPLGFEKKEYVTFIIMTVVGLAINVGIASFIVDFIKPRFGLLPELWANVAAVIAALIAMVWNFSSYKFFVFVKKEKPSDTNV